MQPSNPSYRATGRGGSPQARGLGRGTPIAPALTPGSRGASTVARLGRGAVVPRTAIPLTGGGPGFSFGSIRGFGSAYSPTSSSNERSGSTTPPISPHPPPRPDTPVQLSVDRDILEGLRNTHTALQTIRVPTLDSQDRDVVVRHLRQLGSYNWTKGTAPTMVVPGAPGAWAERPLPYQVEPDTGIAFVDQNSFRAPDGQTLLPIVVAVDKVHEIDARNERTESMGFDWASERIDFMTDRNGLRKLLRWIDASGKNVGAAGNGENDRAMKDWRIDMQLAPGGRTVFLNRWEKRNQEQMPGWTYGFNFEKAATTAPRGVAQSTGHHRIVSYDLNGLKMIVRFEVDAHVPAPVVQRGVGRGGTALDDLAGQLANMRVTKPVPFISEYGLTVIEGGNQIAHDSLVELTTRTQRRAQDMDWTENYPQLFLSQTPNHFLGIHNRGRFVQVVKRVLGRGEFATVEKGMQPSLRKLRKLLAVIAQLVRAHGERGRLTLVCREGTLRVYERESMESCLPDEVLERFAE
ncbi:hypothetical protein C8F01DRAFT_993761 [Mycena amicta]|nr:hypothetical protein C8F01DRAFT_993761 [Mycena amicta]